MSTNTLSLFPARIKIVNPDGTMTPEFYRALQVIVSRLGGAFGDVGGDVFVTQQDITTIQGGSDAGAQTFADVSASAGELVMAEMASQLLQPTSDFPAPDFMVFQPATAGGGVVAVTVGASPYAYVAGKDGSLSVQGGTVSAVTLTRGATVVALGIAGVTPVNQGDVVTVTYTVAPTVNFIPR